MYRLTERYYDDGTVAVAVDEVPLDAPLIAFTKHSGVDEYQTHCRTRQEADKWASDTLTLSAISPTGVRISGQTLRLADTSE